MRIFVNFLFYKSVLILNLFVLICSCEKADDNSNNRINSYGETDSVTDVEGNVYKTVKIGEQWWMAENLRTTKFNDGISIPLVTNNETWALLSEPAFGWYNNDKETYGNKYGALYNGYTVITGNLCPTGWHVPTDDEWTTLTDYLGGESVAGGKLKSTGTIESNDGLWYSPNIGATNETGFSAHPGGYRWLINGEFSGIGFAGHWWNSTEYQSGGVGDLKITRLFRNVTSSYSAKKMGFSVRCIKDNNIK